MIYWSECLCIALESTRHYYLSDPAKSKAEKARPTVCQVESMGFSLAIENENRESVRHFSPGATSTAIMGRVRQPREVASSFGMALHINAICLTGLYCDFSVAEFRDGRKRWVYDTTLSKIITGYTCRGVGESTSWCAQRCYLCKSTFR